MVLCFITIDTIKRIKYAIGDTYLTPCEAEYVGLIVQGYSHPQISEKLDMDVKTIDTNRDNVFGNLGIDNRVDLVLLAIPLVLEKMETTI
ncbi:MAG: helix-turn-helix transcriptional regulator [Flavobacteriales bacterium]|nr:helix-turn-helix transcriptional regulator [Flavobacteriales bacterium]